MTDAACVPGDPTRLGAAWDGTATNLAIYSSAGDYGGSVSVCILADDGGEQRLPLFPTPAGVWHGRITGLAPGQRYGVRVSGPHDPSRGLFFDPNVLLIDPYARALTPDPSGDPRRRQGVVVDGRYDWGDDRAPRIPLADSVIYESHVRGLTMRHPAVEPAKRGTYAGLAHPEVIGYLKNLGVTAVELMPVHESVSEPELLARGLVNYWGYETLGFFAPQGRYSSSGTRGEQVTEFRDLVKALHAEGLEVILDVVYNHTGEGGPGDPPLFLRGLANEVYYRLDPGNPGAYFDTTETGNSLDPGRLQSLRLITDSLRYWVEEMHVDGFRFDLAAELLRQHGLVDRAAAFVDLLGQDPSLAQVKLIAEPWDVGQTDSYEAGSFQPGWSEWNDLTRDGVRSFWLDGGRTGDLATRLAGSSDRFEGTHRGPEASINYLASHDGRTANDLVTYSAKHNEANGNNNTDGPSFEFAVNFGVEGPSDDPAIEGPRAQAVRNMLATLLLCQGVPMLLGGDERRRTQQGNNNAYCQDNELTWYDWADTPRTTAMTTFVSTLIAVRRAHPALRRNVFLTGKPGPGGLADITWFGVDGGAPDWSASSGFLGCLLAGDATGRSDPAGRALLDSDVVVLLNGTAQAASVAVPGRAGSAWTVILTTDTDTGAPPAGGTTGTTLTVPARTVLVATSPLPGA
ncbi:MAG TPA: glycogen debranching protein GlgX [Sinomonas sp.]|nr:glycogen debranching protein GlgX [Sinomonas sp.]